MILSPLMLVIGASIVVTPVCLVGQMHSMIGVVCTSSVEMGV